MAQTQNIVSVILKCRRRFESELYRCRTLARARRLERDWTKPDSGVIDHALKTYRPLRLGLPGNRKIFKKHLTDHARRAVEDFEILFE